MSADPELPAGPGYDKKGNWHGSSTDEVLYWKRRAETAEKRIANREVSISVSLPHPADRGFGVWRDG